MRGRRLVTASYSIDRKFLINYLAHKNFYEGSHCGGYVDVAIDTVGGEPSKVDSLLCELHVNVYAISTNKINC